MPLYIVRNDITRMHVDAIVNAANNTLLGGGGVDGAIHRAAGPGLLEECAALGGCPTGDARITGGHDLPARHVIHTVGPIWRGGNSGEEELLRSCYRRCLELARDNLCATVAFPLISAGVYGYPRRQALKVASETITDFLLEDDAPDMTVYMVIFDRTSMDEGRRLFPDIARFIDNNYVRAHSSPRREDMRRMRALRTSSADVFPASAPAAPNDGSDDDIALPGLGLFEPHADSREASNIGNVPEPTIDACEKNPFESGLFTSLEDALHMMDESFSQMVTRLIKEKGMKNSDCYKKANLDKKLFSKINSDIHYRPRKTTALSLAIALELPIDQTKELLTKAGLALTHSEKFDIIVEYFILRGVYDIFTINEVLFEYDQPLLGGAVL